MKKLHSTTQYKRDYKRFRNNPKKLENHIEYALQVTMPVIWSVILMVTFC